MPLSPKQRALATIVSYCYDSRSQLSAYELVRRLAALLYHFDPSFDEAKLQEFLRRAHYSPTTDIRLEHIHQCAQRNVSHWLEGRED